MTDPRPAQGAAHASHDQFVIAAAADRDADATARAAADAQLRECADCAALFADLRAISTGLASLPREVQAPRDFRISPERAASLRRRGWRAAIGGLFGSASLGPLGTAFATLGFAGLMLTVAIPALFGGLGAGGGSSAPALTQQSQQAPAASAASAPEVVSGGPKAGSPAPADNAAGGGAGSVVGASAAPAGSGDRFSAGGASQAPTHSLDALGPYRSGSGGTPVTPAPLDPLAFLPWLSLGLFVVGLGLLVMASFGGRVRAGS